MTSSWITVGFVPATEPFFAHKVNPCDSTTTLTEQIPGWLIQHKYPDAEAAPIKSRVVAGVLRKDEVRAVDSTLTMFVGVYREGETPHPNDVEAAQQRG
jgi:hypothetical protein